MSDRPGADHKRAVKHEPQKLDYADCYVRCRKEGCGKYESYLAAFLVWFIITFAIRVEIIER